MSSFQGVDLGSLAVKIGSGEDSTEEKNRVIVSGGGE